jgi:hypothetical protein
MGQIQRIQSVYLFLAAAIAGLLFSLPFAVAPVQKEGVFLDGMLNLNDHPVLMTLAILSIVLSSGTIFLFNNRNLQMNLGKLNILLIAGLLSFAGYLFYSLMNVASLSGGLFIPVIVLVLVFMANRNIQKDENLVRDSDRLR